MNIKHICFDLDGVLINSLEIMESSWLEAAQKYNLDTNFNSYKKHIGIPFFDILYKLGIEESYWEKIKKTYDEISTIEINNIQKYEGVDSLLDYLSSKDISYSIFTSKTKKRTNEILLKHFENKKFAKVLCPEDLPSSEGKPSGFGLEQIISNLKIPKEEFLYVGDTLHDVMCAKNADVKFILADWGYGNLEISTESAKDINEFINMIEIKIDG